MSDTAFLKQGVAVYTVSERVTESYQEDAVNEAYCHSVEDLPSALANENSTQSAKLLYNSLNLESPVAMDAVYRVGGPGDLICTEHQDRISYRLCVDCMSTACEPCYESHHSSHKSVATHQHENMLANPATSSDVREKLQECLGLLNMYQSCLNEQLSLLDNQLEQSLNTIDYTYDALIERIKLKRKDAKLQLMEAAGQEKNQFLEELDKCREKADQISCAFKLGSADELPNLLQPLQMVVPHCTVEVKVNVEPVIPDCEIKIEKKAKCLRAGGNRAALDAAFTHLKTIGSKGSKVLEFNLPSGVCLDSDNNIYIADEGNNRIQKISNKGIFLDSFAWSQTGHYVTDVAYSMKENKLLVPRAQSDHGVLKCSVFSYVTLNGQETSRFEVPGMVAGLLVSCSPEGHIIVTDVIKKSVFLIKDNKIMLEIFDDHLLMQPGRATYGLFGEILVVDCKSGVVRVFDHNGLYIRDIGRSGSTESELKRPRGIGIDRSCGVLAVTDWSGDRVHFYSYDGRLLSIVKDFRCPSSVAFSSNHHLVISDCFNCQIKIYQYFTVASNVSHTTHI